MIKNIIDIMDIAKKIITYLGNRAYKKLERNHKTLKILKALGIGELKADIQSVYAHALVEYAVDAVPVELVTLFALNEVKEAFQTGLYKNRETEFDRIVEHQFNSNQKLGFLKNIYTSAAELQPEIRRFRDLYEYYTQRTASAFQIKKYNQDNKFQWEMLEEKQRKSFDFQAEQYLSKLIEAFHKEFLEKKRYIDLNAETRVEKQTPAARGVKAFEKGKEREDAEPAEPAYDSIPHRPMDTYINEWLRDNSRKFLVIIGEYGTGKTTFLRRMAHQLASNRLEPGSETAMADPDNRLPLFFPLRDFEKRMETYIVSRLNVDGITDIDFARFRERIKNNECILLLDGFDEMTQKIDADEKGRNFDKIRKLIETGETGKIILTTRREYFRSTAELREVFKHGDKTNYDFIHLLPFDDDQIQAYLQTHTDDPDFYWKQIEEIFDLHDLAKRPVLLELIVKYLPGLVREAEKEKIAASDLYARCINDELRRKSGELQFIVPGEYRLDILQKVAVWLFLNNALGFDTGLLESELNLKRYFQTERWWEFEKYLNEFLTFTFLIRESDNRYRMSHKSFRDYLTAQAFVREINTGKIEFFAKNRLTDEVKHFMREQGPDEKELLKLVLTARDLSEATQWQGTNAANILLKMDRAGLKGKDLSRCQLSYVNFGGCDLTGTNFKETNLSDCDFIHKSILSAQLGNTNFENSSLDLQSAGIKDITFLKAFKKLVDLTLWDNEIRDISPLRNLKSLTYLDLDGNPLTDISPIQGLKNLRDLVLSKDQVPETQIKAVKEAIPGITIHEL
ncbi:MAG: NACHT domain-containing protein [bacterium]|nr:NACHT domain-containing protein [bacterium]